MALSSDICFKCNSNNTKQYADVFDADYEKIFSEVIERHHVDINQYRQKIITTQNDETNDIPFQQIYREFQQTVSHRSFISVILHLDGIGLGKSNKLVLWLLSCTIVELPPHLRNKRENMIPLSAWIAPREPIIQSWLNECMQRLKYLKLSGILVGAIKRWFIYFIGVICDCPAMKLILNHIGNNGYYSCWYCKIRGIHISNKRQYYFEKAPIMRTIDSYVNESMKAEETRENTNGHLGMSILHQILDIRLPNSIMMDYMHITLLRHTRVVTQQLATEIKNLLFYGIIPLFYSYLPTDKAAHISLFVCAIRMLHGEKQFGSETGQLAHQLLVAYYKDHKKYYDGLENLVLHLHIHFLTQYNNYGSLNNTNCFAQESFLGAFSKNKHGSHHWGDLLMYYFNIDFALRKKLDRSIVDNLNIKDGPFDTSIRSIYSVEQLLMWHASVCDCKQIETCIIIYNRCTIKYDLDEQQEELDEYNDEVISSITPSQRSFTTQSQHGTSSSIEYDLSSLRR
ncbi:unnamed protein product [Rotaria sp. Silwood1]|nr:unnamed protein product [Rotaria sp. Silwood1]